MAGSIYGVYGATREHIIKRGCTLLVNAAQELPKQEIPGVESIKLFLDDTPYAIINVYFDRIADKIHEHVMRGGKSLVHCVLGVSRSTSLVLAYLMKYKNMSLKNAFDSVSARRPCVRPNPGFWKQLVDYEKRLINKSTTTTSSLSSNETAIPITIVSSSASLKPSSSNPSQSKINTHSFNYGSNHNLGASNNYYQDYDTINSSSSSSSSRPYSGSRYGSSTYLYGGGLSNISKLYKTVSGHPSSRTDHYNLENSMSHQIQPTTQHRTSLIVNDVNNHRYTIKPANFSTTYRSSYGRF